MLPVGGHVCCVVTLTFIRLCHVWFLLFGLLSRLVDWLPFRVLLVAGQFV